MRLSIDVHLDYAFPEPADVLLQIETAAMPDQRIEAESLVIHSDNPIRAVAGEEGIGQRCWARAEQRLVADYRAIVSVERPAVDLGSLPATPVRFLPPETIRYLLPSRYCESDRFEHFVRRQFAGLSGGMLAAALVDWVQGALEYSSAATESRGSALTTFAERRGVCRDYAHLLVALARSAEIPARCVAVYAPGVDPPDFHAVAELWLGGAWRLVDATGMANCADIARVAVGRDATDIAFMTIFGTAYLFAQTVNVRRLEDQP
ncbi:MULTISPECIES: transglutaminase-like domain-containing protein [unclassified Sphingomonas]|uniref:transglutaminase-like domain-containing protein n=1 Tax=unclassified Sphingomonas TaxID=196159 RepID=UPI001D0FB00D|nr:MULTISPECIES: transglutaminase family protein [unclassified Sphingomonas]MCC2979882.1 transglutaminase family protein [Sphingomonas sp. IC4-52]MCD2314643.1 transglutaminase family protein [Sphingomonas sp. IC-11]